MIATQRFATAVLCAATLLAWNATVLAIPTNPDPLHTAAATPWSSVAINVLNPATNQHQHRDGDNLFGIGGSYKTYSVWDDNAYRYNAAADAKLANYAHGFMEQQATYSYDVSVPAWAKPLFDSQVVDFWENEINTNNDTNSNGVPIRTKINFNPVNLNGDITIVFANNYPTGPAGGIVMHPFPDAQDINSIGGAPGVPLLPGDAPQGGRDQVLAFWTPSIRQITFNNKLEVANRWYRDDTGNPLDDTDTAIQGDRFDFVTTALHEFGHALGLDHEGMLGDTMFGTQATRNFDASGIVRDLDAGTADGSADLYTIAVPEPSSLALCALAPLVLLRRRHGHQR